MNFTPRKLNLFLIFKLPSAYICGVRVKTINEEQCTTTLKLNGINKNPFKSIFWAAQGMAAELATGALVMQEIKKSGKNVSMLVANNNASFSKKAIGRITFKCADSKLISEALQLAITTSEGQRVWMSAKGINKEGAEVSHFNFEWTIKVKT